MSDVSARRPRWSTNSPAAQALLMTLGPATIAAAPLSAYRLISDHTWFPTAAIAAVLIVGAFVSRGPGIWWRFTSVSALVAWSAASLTAHLGNPMRGLMVLLGTVAFVAMLWPSASPDPEDDGRENRRRAGGLLASNIVAFVFGLDIWQQGDPTTAQLLALSAAFTAPAILSLGRGFGAEPRARFVLGSSIVLAGSTAVCAVAGVTFMPEWSSYWPVGLLAPVTGSLFFFTRQVLLVRGTEPTWSGTTLLDSILIHPSRFLVISFFCVCVVGSLLLGLPISTSSGTPLSWLDAMFTAVSATCVTGLIVVDTPVAFNAVGQFVILMLIQIGGLGIMVFSAAAIVMLGRRLSLSHERAAVDIVGASGRDGLVRALRGIFLVTFGTEFVAATLLFVGFLEAGDPIATAAWRAVFTAVSAFCNAGFALQSDSLIPYSGNPYILGVVAVTIIVGGLGPAVVAAMVAWKERPRRSLHARIVLLTTALLIIGPSLLIIIFEWNESLGDLSVFDRLVNGVFQAITLRTAGFNSVDLTQIHPATWTLMIALMFIGGSPGSTAGGAKTTTVAVLMLAIASVVRGRETITLFGRRLPNLTILRALAVATLGAFVIVGALTAIQLTQTIPLDVALFEVVSALATVGLSTGGTGLLDEVGKVLIIACMFTGRVGPLTLFMFLSSRTSDRANVALPEEQIPIG